MAVNFTKGLKVNSPIIFLAGLVFVVGSILTFLLIVKSVFGNYKVEEILPTEENLTMVSASRQMHAAILYSRYTENLLPEGNTWVSDNIDTWETFIRDVKMSYDIIGDQDIELGKLSNYGMLILPGAKSLSDREMVQIKKFLENGGSVFATSGTATFSDEGKWRGWEFFSEVFGLNFTKELEPDEYLTKVHTLRGNLPITAGIPTGYTLNVATWDRPIYAEILDPRTKQLSFWYDFRQEAGLVKDQINKSAGIAYGNYGKGRFIWFGFELNSVIGREESNQDENYWTYFYKLFENSINWLSYMPTAFVRDWPAPYDAAAIFIPTLSKNVNNINYLNGILKEKNYPTTFFVEADVAERNQSTVATLGKYGNVGSIVDIGFLNNPYDTANNLYDENIQTENIRASKLRVEKVAGTNVFSIMPKYGYYDIKTKQGMAKENIACLITDSLTDRSVPKLEVWDGKPVLIITKTARDDNTVIRDYGLTDKEFQRYTYEEDVDRILFEGGLYVFKVHTEYQLQPEYYSVVGDVMDYIRSNNIWLASLDELKTWWLSRGDIEFRYIARSKRRLNVEVFNPDGNKTDNFIVQVYLNKVVADIEISSDIINTVIPDFKYDRQTQVLYLYVNNLEGGETRSFLIDFENVSLL